MGRRFDRTLEIGSAIIGVALISHIVLRPSSAAIIQATNDSVSRMIKIVAAENIITSRNAPRFEEILGAMDDPTITELLAGLNDADLDWVTEMLRDVS